MRILVTNDDGVYAEGIAALARALGAWARTDPEQRQVTVVAPLSDFSGASSMVGAVYERDAVDYRKVVIEGAEDVATYGCDASPALCTILGCLGAFSESPDLVYSGINHGANVGRSALHSGTIGAGLTSTHFAKRALAVSMRAGRTSHHFDSAARLAVGLIDDLAAAPERTVWNLNVPDLPMAEIRGIRRGRLGSAAIIRGAWGPGSAETDAGPGAVSTVSRVSAPGAAGEPEHGQVRLTIGGAVPNLDPTSTLDSDEDAGLVAAGYASLTPLTSVREDFTDEANSLVSAAVEHLSDLR